MSNGGNGKQVQGKPPDNSGNTGRNPDGTFTKGNGGMGGGRPRSQRSLIMEQALDAGITPAKAKAIVAKILQCALEGEQWACREILDRTVGKPKERIDISGEFTVTEFLRAIRDPQLLAG